MHFHKITVKKSPAAFRSKVLGIKARTDPTSQHFYGKTIKKSGVEIISARHDLTKTCFHQKFIPHCDIVHFAVMLKH